MNKIIKTHLLMLIASVLTISLMGTGCDSLEGPTGPQGE